MEYVQGQKMCKVNWSKAEIQAPAEVGFDVADRQSSGRVETNSSYLSTQPGHPSVGRRNEYQPKGGDALRLGSKDRYGLCVGGM